MLQRNVGFEFELEDPTVNVYQYSYLRGYHPLTKRDRVLTGTNFYVETDYLSGGRSAWEFVTRDFPETGPGLLDLQQALMDIDGIVDLLRSSPLTATNQPPVYNPVDGGFSAYGTVTPNRYFTVTSKVFKTKPQVTAGFDLVALNALFRSAASARGPGVSNLVRDVGSLAEAGGPSPSTPDPRLSAMWTRAGTAVVNSYGGAGALAGPAAEGLQALVTQAMQMILGGQRNVGVTPKTVLGLVLHRTDFKAMFNQLPNPLRANIEADPASFVSMVMGAVNKIATVENDSPVISANLFTDASMKDDPHYNMPSPFGQVSCGQWLTAIATPGGSDLLSAGLYPIRKYYCGLMNDRTDAKANELLGSMGALHQKLDPGNRPIFEIRSSKQIHAGLIPAYALDFFKYVRYLHNPNALTETSFLTGLATNDLIDLISFTPNRTAVIRNLQTQSFTGHNN